MLGATAGQALLGPQFRVTRQRGRLMPWPASAEVPADFGGADQAGNVGGADQAGNVGGADQAGNVPALGGAFVLATLHPSAVLRADNQDEAYAGLVADLSLAARALTPSSPRS